MPDLELVFDQSIRDWYYSSLERQARNAVCDAMLAIVNAFVIAVYTRAEQEMIKTGTLEGAHYRSIEAEVLVFHDRIKALRERKVYKDEEG
jgi:hypothetical protein